MKTTIVSLVSALIVCFGARADETNQPSGWTPTFNVTSVYATKYLAFAAGVPLYDGPVVQSSLLVNFNNGLYGGLWSSVPTTTGWNENLGSEFDFIAGWSGPLSTFGFSGLLSNVVVDVGLTYFDEPGVFTLGSGDIFNSHISLSRDVGPVNLRLSYENYTTTPGSGFEGGNVVTLAAAKTFHVASFLDLSSSVGVAYDDGRFTGTDSGFLFRGSVEADWKIGRYTTLVLPQINWYVPTMHDVREPDAVIFLGVKFSF